MTTDKILKETCIIIPCYNEQDSIRKLITQIIELVPLAKIVVVDDSSLDLSRDIVKSIKNVDLIELPVNLGIGGTVQAGLKYANRYGYKYLVRLDGDGQHAPDYIETMLEPLVRGEADMTIGSRFVTTRGGFKSTSYRRLGIKIFTLLNRLTINRKITDSTSGYRAYNRALIEFLDVNYPSFDYPEPEEIILLGKNRFNIKEVSVEMRGRTGGNSCINNGLKPVYYMVKVVFAIFMVMLRPRIMENRIDS